MSASEPAMDAVEKVAAVLLPVIREQSGANDADDMWWMGDHATDFAQALIAAFPQLALEGREEYGIRYTGHGIDQVFAGVTHERASTADTMRDLAGAVRTVWESPWSGVQS